MADIFKPYIRKYEYIDEYFKAVYEMYIKSYPAFPVNYYRLDEQESVMDSTGLRTGSYEKLGVGELSGYVWEKIYNLPVYGIEQVNIEFDSGDMGYTAKQSIRSTANIPDVYGFKPKPNDFLDLNYGIQKKNNNDIKVLFVVTNIETAHYGDYLNVYRCSLEIAPITKDQLETQLSKVSSFYEPTKTVLPVSNVYILNKMLLRFSTLSENLDNSFDKERGVYLDTDNI